MLLPAFILSDLAHVGDRDQVPILCRVLALDVCVLSHPLIAGTHSSPRMRWIGDVKNWVIKILLMAFPKAETCSKFNRQFLCCRPTFSSSEARRNTSRFEPRVTPWPTL